MEDRLTRRFVFCRKAPNNVSGVDMKYKYVLSCALRSLATRMWVRAVVIESLVSAHGFGGFYNVVWRQSKSP